MRNLSYDDANKALQIIEDYCNESMKEISEQLKSIKEDELRIKLMDRYAKIKQVRDSITNTCRILFDNIDPKK